MTRETTKQIERECIITVKTVPTTPARMIKGEYRGFVFSLRADPANTGYVYIGKDKMNCTYPLGANAEQTTKTDIDKLFFYSDNGTEKLHIWGEKE